LAGTLSVLQLVPALGDGGVERGTVEMARHLAALGVPNWVAASPGPLAAEIEAAGAAFVPLAVGSKHPLAAMRAVTALARLIDETGITILHARSRMPAWIGWLAAGRARARPHFVTTFHGTYGHGSRLKRAYNGIMLRGPVVIANSRFIAEHIRTVYPRARARIVVAPRGVDTAVFDPARVPPDRVRAIRAAFGAETVPLLVKVARLSRWKGHRRLIEALAALADQPWKMVFVGGGEAEPFGRDLVAAAASLGLGPRIHFAGSRRDIPEILAAADLAFSVADEAPEAFGRAVIEAGAMARPVIATAHGGSLETVLPGRTGWLVPPGETGALAAAIREALADPGRARAMGEAGRAHILAQFALEAMLSREVEVYRGLIEGRHRE
jgi:glycosyltransferase involved in cell wall biosynthesis